EPSLFQRRLALPLFLGGKGDTAHMSLLANGRRVGAGRLVGAALLGMLLHPPTASAQAPNPAGSNATQAEQIRQLQQADQRRQAELEQLKATNDALSQKLQLLVPTDRPAVEGSGEQTVRPAEPAIDPQYQDPNASPTKPGSPVAKAASAGYTRL